MRSVLPLTIFCLVNPILHAQQPEVLPAPRSEKVQPKTEVLPVPGSILPGQPIIRERIVPGPQVGRRNVWELLSVDYRGMWVPRVVPTPDGGGYYLYNGQPYPWTTTSSLPWMPYASD